MLKPLQNTESYQKLLKRVKSQSVAECRFPQAGGIEEIIAVEPQISATSCSAASGRVNYSGKLVFTVVYLDGEGKLCRMQKGAEISHFADDEEFTPAQTATACLGVEKLTVRRDGSSFVITAIISADICVYCRSERTLIGGAEGAFVKTDGVELYSTVCFSGESEVEDDFDADCVEDILIPSAKAVVLSAECGTGDVEVSGEIALSLFCMRRQTPVCVEKCIPFKTTIVCDSASAGIKAAACAAITDLNVTANVNEDRGKCNLNVVCSLQIVGWFAEGRKENVVADAFSPTNELTLTFTEETTDVCEGVKVYSDRVSGPAATQSRLGYDCTFYAAALPKAEAAYNPATGCAEGAASCTLIYIQNGEIKSCEVTLPFSSALAGVAEAGRQVYIDVAVCSYAVRLKADGEAEAEATLKISATVCNSAKARYVSAMEEGEELPTNDCAVSVFLPTAGDGLWEVAKKLNKSPEDVAACNAELTFPLSGKERILIYRPKE